MDQEVKEAYSVKKSIPIDKLINKDAWPEQVSFDKD